MSAIRSKYERKCKMFVDLAVRVWLEQQLI